MHLIEAKKILNKNGYKLIEVYGNSDSEILADPSFWDYSKQVQHRFKNDGGFIIKPEEQEKLLNNRYYINILRIIVLDFQSNIFRDLHSHLLKKLFLHVIKVI